jgi:hypothetical protein
MRLAAPIGRSASSSSRLGTDDRRAAAQAGPGGKIAIANNSWCGPLWNLGSFGASMLNIYVDEGGAFHRFAYDQDEVSKLRTSSEVESWLESRQAGARQLTPLQRHYVSDSECACCAAVQAHSMYG